MEKLSLKALEVLKEQRYSQQRFCDDYGLDPTNFSVRKGKSNLSLKTIGYIYDCFEIEFNLLEELKTLVQYYLDRPHPTRTVQRDLGITYSRAKYFVREGKGSYKLLNDIYAYNQEARNIIDKYL